ncbi:MAG: fibronectin type III domain-containing protein [Deltaproteobacteria bacterium]|nr:fibronectin type III domain-containing protein [Deltaproteobacteria bacterium]MCL5276617.1 fibronectin type III domain-containing protein [Deltaproteobacteria bacterium]
MIRKSMIFLSLAGMIVLGIGCGSPSKSNPPPQAPPQAPANLGIAPGDRQISLAWSPSTGADGYYLYYYNTGTVIQGNRQFLAKTTSTTYTHSSLTNGVLYEYFISAYNDYGSSTETEEMGVPSSITTISVPGGVTLTWTAVTAPTIPAGYTIFYDSNSGSGQTTSTASTCTVTVPTPGPCTLTITTDIPNYPPDIRVGSEITTTIKP